MASDYQIEQAANLLRAGKLVAFPTETVYGLGANAMDSSAVKEIFRVKGRPSNHPVIVHLADISQLSAWAINISDVAWQLAEKYWPGPLTLILSKAPQVPDSITGGQSTIGLRVPSHPVAQALLKSFNGGIAAPSANRFGHISPTQAEHVKSEFGNTLAMILEGGASEIGIESTIVDLSAKNPRILRPGHVTSQQISAITGVLTTRSDMETPRASGTLAHHYMPQTPLLIVPINQISEIVNKLLEQNKSCVILAIHPCNMNENKVQVLKMSEYPERYAHDLYATLRKADQVGVDFILVQAPPSDNRWAAIKDRLEKASSPEAFFCNPHWENLS